MKYDHEKQMEYYTAKQVAEKLNFGIRTVYNLLNSGELEFKLVGKSKRVTEHQFRKYLKRAECDGDCNECFFNLECEEAAKEETPAEQVK